MTGPAHRVSGAGDSRTASGTATVSARLKGAYAFLDEMVDATAQGEVPRLPRSFKGGYLQAHGYTDSVTYDDALIIEALLSRGRAGDVERARALGDALLYVQSHDPRHDGRIRAAYAAAALTSPDTVDASDATSDIGNMAWAGQALLQLYKATEERRYLSGAAAVAHWAVAETRDNRGAGGFTGGMDDGGRRIRWKSTEHNLDLVVLFRMLAQLTGDAAWSEQAWHARSFVTAMYDPAKHVFWTGTGDDGVAPSKDLLAEDAQSWSCLVLRERAYAGVLDTEATGLAASDGHFHGVAFSDADRSGVWFEGSAHLALAFAKRHRPGDAARSDRLLHTLELAQTTAPHHDGHGLVAASHDGLNTGDGGDSYYASLHTGATAWYILASQARDPFTLFSGAPPRS